MCIGMSDNFTFHTFSMIADHRSLGTVIWQIMNSEFPYAISQPVTPQTPTEYSELKKKLAQKVLPGGLEKLPAKVAGIVERCWNLNPLLRPTSIEIALALQDLIAEEASKDDNPQPTSDDEGSTSESSPSEPSGHLDDAIKLIRKARMINLESPTIKPTPGNISNAAFESLLSGNDLTAVQYFAVGGLILWKLTEHQVSALHRPETTWPILNDEGTAFPTLDCTFTNESVADRARTALFYLEYAAAMGYEDAYLEMYKAHAFLARDMKAMSINTIEQTKKDILVGIENL